MRKIILVIFICISFSRISFTQQAAKLKLVKIIQSESEIDFEILRQFQKKRPIQTSSSKVKIYNSKTQSYEDAFDKSALPADVNTTIWKEGSDCIVAYSEQENATKYLYFLNKNGVLETKYEVNIYPHVQFSKNSDVIEVYNLFGREIFLFNTKGELIQKLDYIDIIENNQLVLYGVYSTNNGQQILLNTSSAIHLYDKNKGVLWERGSNRIVDCQFYNELNSLAVVREVKIRPSNGKRNISLNLISKENGELLDEIVNVDQVVFGSGKMYVKRQDKYEEYIVE